MASASQNSPPPSPHHDPISRVFPLGPDEIFAMVERKDVGALSEAGGVPGFLKLLRSDSQTGLTTEEATRPERRLVFGENRLPVGEKADFWGMVKEALKDKMMLMLIFCAFLSIFFGLTMEDPADRSEGWIEGTAILVSVSVVVLLSSFSDYQKAKKFEELSEEQSVSEVSLVRDGVRQSVESTEVVVGDLLLIEGGQTMRVDALVVESQDLYMNESNITGESDSVKKEASAGGDPADGFLLSGSEVMEGTGTAIVVAVGVHSFSGRMEMKTRKGQTETPLQEKLGVLADTIGWWGAVGAVVTWAILSGLDLYRVYITKEQKFALTNYLQYVIVAITIVVVAIPEGLPLAVTIALAYSMKAMTKDRCLVRVLKSCETMGGCTTICSDKTGTLTSNTMTVVQGWVAGESFVIPNRGVTGPPGATNPFQQPGGSFTLASTPAHIVDQLCTSLTLNSSAEIWNDPSSGKKIWHGNRTEQGLLRLVEQVKGEFQSTRDSVPKENKRVYPFSSARKRMTTMVRQNGKLVAHVKGAPEMLLEECTRVVSPNGGERILSLEEKGELIKLTHQMADQGNRTLAICYAEVQEGWRWTGFPEEEPTPSLVLIAILGMQDPIRETVTQAVDECSQAGITVCMVTGDSLNTATAIAKKCGILKGEEHHSAIEGREFRDLAERYPGRLDEMLPQLRVVARATPDDKHILVSCLMKRGDIVAVTGDGTNDAPALTLANVGLSMKSGTDVAMGASDMILMDDNFSTVVTAAMWGRTVNDNIRKFIQFQLTTNLVGVVLTLLGSAMSDDGESPLTPVQLLWLNLIMDTMAALALSTEQPTRKCLQRDPVWKDAPLISKAMWCFITCHGLFQLTTMLLLISYGHTWFGVGKCDVKHPHSKLDALGNCHMGEHHRTIVFNVFILFQVVNEFNARKLYAGEYNPFEGMGRSMGLIGVFFVTIAYQIFAVQWSGEFMDTESLSHSEWRWCLFIAMLELPLGVFVKFLSGLFETPRGTAYTDPRSSLAGNPRSSFDVRLQASLRGVLMRTLPKGRGTRGWFSRREGATSDEDMEGGVGPKQEVPQLPGLYSRPKTKADSII